MTDDRTTAHTALDDAARDAATLYALDDPAGPDRATYEAHLALCAVCRAEVDELGATFDELALSGATVAPPPDLKQRLLDRAADGAATSVQTWKRWTESPSATPFTFVRAGEVDWEPTGVDGVEVRRLLVDAANDRVTMLVRMQPGSSYPSHRHSAREECYVLEGDVTSGGERLHTGDFVAAHAGSVHDTQATRDGCLLLIVSSMSDEVMPADLG